LSPFDALGVGFEKFSGEESLASLGKRFSCRVANMKDNHVITGDFVKNEVISNGHHPVLEIADGKGEAFREILQRKTGVI
jgi:uncharacterized protein (UPF0218 family)